MINNILLSGGWGYGNLGDDALLESSIRILRDFYPQSKIIIMSYDPSESTIHGCEVIPSIHRAIYGRRAFKYLRIYGKSWNYDKYPTLIARIINKVERMIAPFLPKSDDLLIQFKANKTAMKQYQEVFQNSDMFVMSGGGYFNDWEDSFNSRYMELQLAKEANIPVYICGQTIGPLTKEQSEIITPLLNGVEGIYVRDIESEKDLNAMGCTPIVAPDLALSYVGKGMLSDSICVIPAEYPKAVRGELVKTIRLISERYNIPVVLTATRLYNRDINCLREIYAKLKSLGINVKMVIPKDYEEVKNTIKGHMYVISRNLHGLILGWREGAMCLCLCNERKFVSFMKQIGHEDCIVDVYKTKAKDIYQMFSNLTTLNENHVEIQKSISEEVIKACKDTFNI